MAVTISKTEKKKLLLEIFDALSPGYNRNRMEIRKCVSEMMKLDPNSGIELWKSLLLAHTEENHASEYPLCCYIDDLEAAVGAAQCYEIIAKDEVLKYNIYHEAGQIHYCPAAAVTYFISMDKIQTAQDLLQLMNANRYLTTPWNDILEIIIEEFLRLRYRAIISHDGYDLLAWWIEEKVNHQADKDNLYFKLMSLGE